MPNYNKERFIAKSIQSVLTQTLVDLELIVVDDKSTDDSLKIAKEFAEKDSRIKILTNDTNMGCAFSENRGMGAASGEFVCFIGSDDVVLPTRLEKMVQSLEHNRRCVGYTDVFTLDENDRVLRANYIGTKLPPSGYSYPFILSQVAIGLDTFMAHISTIREVGNRDETLRWGDDFDYVLRLTERHDIALVPEALYGYRRHRQSLTGQSSPKLKARAYLQILERNLGKNWRNLDSATRFKTIQRIRMSARESGLKIKYLRWSLSPSFLRLAIPRLSMRVARRIGT